MSKIDFDTYLKRIEEGVYHFYDIPSETCYFPFTNEEIDMCLISDSLDDFAVYLCHKESFEERVQVAESKPYRDFVNELIKEKNYICEISGFSYKKAKQLDFDLFNIPSNKRWINNFLVAHHVDGTCEYDCRDRTKIKVLNRAIHLILHRYSELSKKISWLDKNYDIWYELGCLIKTRRRTYPWRRLQ